MGPSYRYSGIRNQDTWNPSSMYWLGHGGLHGICLAQGYTKFCSLQSHAWSIQLWFNYGVWLPGHAWVAIRLISVQVQRPKETPYVLHVFNATVKNHTYPDFEYKLKIVPFPSCLMLYLTNNYLMHLLYRAGLS